MRAVIVIELDVIENSADLAEAAQIIHDAKPPHATRMHLAIHEPADQVMAVLDHAEEKP